MPETFKPTHFWYRRISEAVLLASLTIIVLFIWSHVASNTFLNIRVLPVSSGAAALSIISFIVSGASCLWTPKRYQMWPSLLAFIALGAAAAVLILTTNGAQSPFLPLWMVIAIFAGVFGLGALLSMALVPVIYLAWLFFDGTLASPAVAAAVLAGEMPLIASYLVWSSRSPADADRDRTYQQLATELSQVSDKAEVVINAITDGVIALDSQGTVQLINPAAQQVVGWGKQDAVTLNYKSVLKLIDSQGKELTTANDPVIRVLSTNQEVSTSDLTLVTNSGKKLLVSLVVSPAGQPGSGVIIVFRDITKEKAEERQQAEFISTASHEMRTPVAAIEGYLGLALNPATAQIDEAAREYITKAHEGAEHLGRLFQDLLDISKAEDGRLSNNPSVVDVVAFTKDIVQGLKPTAEAKGLHMIFKPQPGDRIEETNARRLNPVYYVHVDNDHLREVIANLIDNAIKYTPQGTVAIDVNGNGDHVIISVEDSGIGIPIEDIPHLFQKFYRIDSSDTREIGGTGLGLYLCRRLIEAMEGRIWAESRYGQGSTFYVELPRISHEEATRLIETVDSRRVISASQTTPWSPSDINRVMSASSSAEAGALTPVGKREDPSLAAIEKHPEKYLTHPQSAAATRHGQNQS